MISINMAAFSDELEKLAKVTTPLQPHQRRLVDKLLKEDQPGLVAVHGLGSGKTLSSIAAHDALQMPADIVVPAALQENFAKEMKKHHTGPAPEHNIKSLQNITAKDAPPEAPMLIADEAHRLRDPSSKSYQVLAKNKAQKRLLLTATPFYNHPADIAPLVNLAAGEKKLPGNRGDFERAFISERIKKPGLIARLRGVKPGVEPGLNPKKAKELKAVLNKWVDYYEGSKTDFPEVSREDVKVQMSPHQQEVYDTVMGKAPFWVRHKVKSGLPPSKAEGQQLNAFLGGVRQVSNTTAPFSTNAVSEDPKIQRAFEELKKELDSNPRSKGVVYSNFINAGLNPYKKRMDAAKIPYGEFTGEMSKDERDELVKKYNENKLRALLISSAGAEGLDLKGTRLMQVLEPHWNEEKLKQVEGRGIRYKSHADLPEDERKVRIQRFLATRAPQGMLEKLKMKNPGMGIDEYMTQLAGNKERLNHEFRELLKSEQAQV